MATLCLFRDDSGSLTEAAATVLEVQDRGGIILDKTVFYVTGGGQPGDSGVLQRTEGAPVEISTAVYGDGGNRSFTFQRKVLESGWGEPVVASIDWTDTDTCASTRVCIY